jgi:hypothetical protein
MNPQVLKKLEKGLAQLSTGLRTLSKVCGLLSEVGDKKIPKKPSSGQKVPATDVVPKKLKPTSFDLFKKDEGFQSRLERVSFFLMMPRNKWGITPYNDALKWLFGDYLRSDRFKNAWVLVGKKWGKISQRQYEDLFQVAEVFYDECQYQLGECNSLAEFRKYLKYPEFKESKWERRQHWKKELTRAHMTEFTREVHDELPSLRGGKA